MTFELIFVLVLLLLTFAAMVWEKVSVDVVAMLGMCALIAGGVLTAQEAFGVFANDAAITVASMFVLSAALIRTGALEGLERWITRLGGGSELKLLLVVLPVTAFLSSFVNNTPIVVMLLPILVAQARKFGLNQSALLLPVSYASIMGGLCTLVGTSTTILVSATATRLGHDPIQMFEVTPLGLLVLVCGMGYYFWIGRHLLPLRLGPSHGVGGGSRSYLSELVVTPDSEWLNSPLEETPLNLEGGFGVLDVVRKGSSVSVPLSEVRLKAGDVLRVACPRERLMEVQNLEGLDLRAEHQWGESLMDGEEKKKSKSAAGPEVLRIAESVISPRSRMVGMSVRDLDFRRRYGVLVVGIHRRGSGVMKEDFSAVALEAGDTLLLQGDELALQRLEVDDDFLLLTRVAHLGLRRSRRWVALGLAVAVVVLATFGVLPIAALALMAAVLCVVTGCVEPREAYEAVDWRIIMMIFGMLSLGLALEKTGGADLAAEAMVHWFGGYGPWVMLSVLLLVVSVSTELLSNNAVAVLMTPIAIHVAEVMGVDVRPFLMAVVLGGSASFATPIGYQTNTIVYGAGGYRFSDFMRVGVPLNLLVWLIGTLAIPFLWRF